METFSGDFKICLYQRASQGNLNKWCKTFFVVYCRETRCVCVYLQPLVLVTCTHVSNNAMLSHFITAWTKKKKKRKKELDQRSQHKADTHTHANTHTHAHARLKHKGQLVLKMKTALHTHLWSIQTNILADGWTFKTSESD